MPQRAADAVFQGMFTFCDIKQLLRITAPDHKLDDAQKEKAAKYIASIRKQLDILESELL
jgi:hypothetical protein